MRQLLKQPVGKCSSKILITTANDGVSVHRWDVILWKSAVEPEPEAPRPGAGPVSTNYSHAPSSDGNFNGHHSTPGSPILTPVDETRPILLSRCYVLAQKPTDRASSATDNTNRTTQESFERSSTSQIGTKSTKNQVTSPQHQCLRDQPQRL
jgi:hypothetical protein